jgi:hypothetical protein
MWKTATLTLLLCLPVGLPLRAESITGTVLIHRKLTPSRVTAAVPLYQRGTTVELAGDAETDPLVIERSRVVVYIEGPGPTGEPVVEKMEQQNRRFMQETVVVPVG